VCRDSKVKDPPAIVCQHQKHIKDLKLDGRYREEVYRHQALDVVLEERPPRLRRWLPTAHKVLAHTRFADLNAKLQQLTVSAAPPNPDFLCSSAG